MANEEKRQALDKLMTWRECKQASGVYWYRGLAFALYWRWRGRSHRIRVWRWLTIWDFRFSLPEPVALVTRAKA